MILHTRITQSSFDPSFVYAEWHFSLDMASEPNFHWRTNRSCRAMPIETDEQRWDRPKHTRARTYDIMKNNMFSVIANEFNCIMFEQLNEQVENPTTTTAAANMVRAVTFQREKDLVQARKIVLCRQCTPSTRSSSWSNHCYWLIPLLQCSPKYPS